VEISRGDDGVTEARAELIAQTSGLERAEKDLLIAAGVTESLERKLKAAEARQRLGDYCQICGVTLVELCADCGYPKDTPTMHFEAHGTNWGAALHHYRAPASPVRSNDMNAAQDTQHVADSMRVPAPPVDAAPQCNGPHGAEEQRDLFYKELERVRDNGLAARVAEFFSQIDESLLFKANPFRVLVKRFNEMEAKLKPSPCSNAAVYGCRTADWIERRVTEGQTIAEANAGIVPSHIESYCLACQRRERGLQTPL
jgi:hypothetical protein